MSEQKIKKAHNKNEIIEKDIEKKYLRKDKKKKKMKVSGASVKELQKLIIAK